MGLAEWTRSMWDENNAQLNSGLSSLGKGLGEVADRYGEASDIQKSLGNELIRKWFGKAQRGEMSPQEAAIGAKLEMQAGGGLAQKADRPIPYLPASTSSTEAHPDLEAVLAAGDASRKPSLDASTVMAGGGGPALPEQVLGARMPGQVPPSEPTRLMGPGAERSGFGSRPMMGMSARSSRPPVPEVRTRQDYRDVMAAAGNFAQRGRSLEEELALLGVKGSTKEGVDSRLEEQRQKGRLALQELRNSGRLSATELANAARILGIEMQQTGAGERVAAQQAGAGERVAAQQAGANERQDKELVFKREQEARRKEQGDAAIKLKTQWWQDRVAAGGSRSNNPTIRGLTSQYAVVMRALNDPFNTSDKTALYTRAQMLERRLDQELNMQGVPVGVPPPTVDPKVWVPLLSPEPLNTGTQRGNITEDDLESAWTR